MTDDLKERTMLGAFRDWGANLAGFLLNMFAVTIITHFSASDQNMDKRGYLALGIIVAVCCVLFTSVAALGTKERIRPPKNTAKLTESLKSIGQNKPALCILFMVFFINSFVAFRSTFTTYYALYYLGDENMIPMILTTMYTLPLLGLLFVPKLIEMMGNKRMFIISGLCAILSGGPWHFPHIWLDGFWTGAVMWDRWRYRRIIPCNLSTWQMVCCLSCLASSALL